MDLPAYALAVLTATATVSGLYANALLFFTMEIAMQPVLFEIAQQLGDVPDDNRLRVPLRRRLLASVLAITIISGVVVARVAGRGNGGADRLGLDVLSRSR